MIFFELIERHTSEAIAGYDWRRIQWKSVQHHCWYIWYSRSLCKFWLSMVLALEKLRTKDDRTKQINGLRIKDNTQAWSDPSPFYHICSSSNLGGGGGFFYNKSRLRNMSLTAIHNITSYVKVPTWNLSTWGGSESPSLPPASYAYMHSIQPYIYYWKVYNMEQRRLEPVTWAPKMLLPTVAPLTCRFSSSGLLIFSRYKQEGREI